MGDFRCEKGGQSMMFAMFGSKTVRPTNPWRAFHSAGVKGRWILHSLALLAWLVGSTIAVRGGDIEQEPINYSKAPASNCISRLQQRLDSNRASLRYDGKF